MEYENIIQQVDLRFWSQLRCKRTTRSISDRFAPQGRKNATPSLAPKGRLLPKGRKKILSGVSAPQMKASYSLQS